MTFSKEQLSQAFIDVLTERVPDFSDIPDHVFSERFEKKMDRLIRREAAHPWAVSHTLARNLIAAAIVILLLFTLCMSVSAIRNAIFNFFRIHFDAHDEIVFNTSESRKSIEHEFVITELPKGFLLEEEALSKSQIVRIYVNNLNAHISLRQSISFSGNTIIDNERSQFREMEIDGHGVFIAIETYEIIIAWENDGYEFWLEINEENLTLDEAIRLFRCVKPTR